jgi:hypothetical protein
MSYEDEMQLLETFDKWDDRDRRERFIHRMERKLNAKERYRK